MRDDPMQELADLEEVLGETSACGLGMAAPFITKTLKKYWPDVLQNYIAGHGIENIREKDSK